MAKHTPEILAQISRAGESVVAVQQARRVDEMLLCGEFGGQKGIDRAPVDGMERVVLIGRRIRARVVHGEEAAVNPAAAGCARGS